VSAKFAAVKVFNAPAFVVSFKIKYVLFVGIYPLGISANDIVLSLREGAL
jgi:hypothetical protein